MSKLGACIGGSYLRVKFIFCKVSHIEYRKPLKLCSGRHPHNPTLRSNDRFEDGSDLAVLATPAMAAAN